METLKKQFSEKNQISPKLLDLLYESITISTNNYYLEIATILLFLDLINKLGWIEHTSDWDLGMTIILRNNKKIEIQQGYADSLTMHDMNNEIIEEFNYFSKDDKILKLFTLQLTENNCDTDDIDVIPISIKISQIKSICVYD